MTFSFVEHDVLVIGTFPCGDAAFAKDVWSSKQAPALPSLL